MKKIFGTDGIRGKIGEYPMLPDTIVKIGFHTGKVLIEQSLDDFTDKPTVIIGKDPRLSGYMIESALEAGFAAAGVNVLLTGPLPSPGIAYLVRALRLQAGLMISASHNPYCDNGIKIFDRNGLKLPDATEAIIESKLTENITITNTDKVGRARRIDDAQGRYVEFCKSRFPEDLDLRGLNIVVDAANGAGYQTLPAVIHELGAKVTVIGNNPNGFNINHQVGATYPKAIQEKVLAKQANIGIAIDGDGDRISICDHQGKIYDGDDILFILSRDPENLPDKSGVVGTLMTNAGLEQSFKDRNIPFTRVKVGDRYVLEKLLNKNWNLGGETSGHIIMLDQHFTGDGTLAALKVLSRMIREEQELSELNKGWQKMPQRLVNVEINQNYKFNEDPNFIKKVKEIENNLNGNGRLLIRPSGTEPILRILVEARDNKLLELADSLANKIKQ